jgi:hypothetical protein
VEDGRLVADAAELLLEVMVVLVGTVRAAPPIVLRGLAEGAAGTRHHELPRVLRISSSTNDDQAAFTTTVATPLRSCALT